MMSTVQTRKTLQVERRANGTIILDGWCEVGSIVYSNFRTQDGNEPQQVIKIVVWPGDTTADVWTDGGDGPAMALERVDFRKFISQEPI